MCVIISKEHYNIHRLLQKTITKIDAQTIRIIEKIKRPSLSIIADRINGIVVKDTKPTKLANFFVILRLF